MKRWLVLALALVLVLGVTGCKKAEDEIAEKVAEDILSDGDTKVDIEQDGDSVTIETDDGETTISGGDNKLPDDFPRDFPINDDYENTGTSKITGAEGTSYYVNLKTDDDFTDVYEWFKSELADEGWDITTDMLLDEEEDSALISATKGDMDVTMSVSEVGGDSEIGIILNVPK